MIFLRRLAPILVRQRFQITITRSHASSFKPLNVFAIDKKNPTSDNLSPKIKNKEKPDFKLRDYQEEIIQTCLDSFNEGKRRIGVSLATGGGKTVIFASLIDKVIPINGRGNKTLILVHRVELARQAAESCERNSPNSRVEIDMGNIRASQDADIIVASVQTLARGERLLEYNPEDYKLIIIDECHHAVAKSYLTVLSHFKADTKDTETYVAGFSATFERADNMALSTSIDHIVYHRDLVDMINDKWLCDVKFNTVQTDVDLSIASKSRKDDFNTSLLSSAMNTPKINQLVVDTYIQYKEQTRIKSTILFGVDVKHIKDLTELFKENGINALYVTATTAAEERRNITQDFKDGKFPVLLNCGIFTEGTDIPNIDSILLVRPTKSRGLFIQMVGRGLRLHEDKSHCHIIDFVGAHAVGVQSIPTLMGLDKIDVSGSSNAEEVSHGKKNNELESSIESISLHCYDGFLSLIENSTADQQLIENILLEFQQNFLPWIRIAEFRWVVSLHDGNSFLSIEKVSEDSENAKDATLKFELSKYVPFPKDFRAAKDYKMPKYKIEKITSGPLALLFSSSAAQFGNPKMMHLIYSKKAVWRSTNSTEKQQKFVRSKFIPRFNKLRSSKKETQQKLDNLLSTLTKGEVSDIILSRTAGSNMLIDWYIRRLTESSIYDQKSKTYGKNPDSLSQYESLSESVFG